MDEFELIILNVEGDGHCLFHSLLLAFFTPYINEKYNEGEVTRLTLVKKLREDLANKLGTFVPGSKTIRHYDLLYNKNINYFAEHVHEFTLINMQQTLNSNQSIGYGYLEFICDQINKDVYIIDGHTLTLYQSDEASLLIKNRLSIILFYLPGHYQLVGLKSGDEVVTHFKPTHPFIRYLNDCLNKFSIINE